MLLAAAVELVGRGIALLVVAFSAAEVVGEVRNLGGLDLNLASHSALSLGLAPIPTTLNGAVSADNTSVLVGLDIEALRSHLVASETHPLLLLNDPGHSVKEVLLIPIRLKNVLSGNNEIVFLADELLEDPEVILVAELALG